MAKMTQNRVRRLSARGKSGRQERQAQLLAFGVMLEQKYRNMAEAERAQIRAWVQGLDARNTLQAQAGFLRLERENPDPLDAMQPNAVTLAAMQENINTLPRAHSVEELFAELNAPD